MNLTNNQVAELLEVMMKNEEENRKKGCNIHFPEDPELFEEIFRRIMRR